VQFSNTFYFYKKGWRGINVDATPGAMKLFNLLRPNDINLEIGISGERCETEYYLFDWAALNTFSLEAVKYAKTTFNQEPKKVVRTKFYPLAEVLDKYMPSHSSEIDFLSVDVEGADEAVLRSNNWTKYKPKVVCVECHLNFDEFKNTTLCKFLEDLNYHFAAKTGPSYFYYYSG
jgi:hypothetical protein